MSGLRNGATESLPAYELLSASCGLAVQRYMPGKEKEAAFLFTIDSGMDVLNSGHPRDAKPLRRGYSGMEKVVGMTQGRERKRRLQPGQQE